MFNRALNIKFRIHKNIPHSDIATSYINFSAIYIRMGYTKSAELLLHKSQKIILTLFHDEANSMMAVARLNLGTTYKDQSDFEKAMEQYEASLLIMYKIYSQNLDHPQIIECEHFLSVVIENYQAEIYWEVEKGKKSNCTIHLNLVAYHSAI